MKTATGFYYWLQHSQTLVCRGHIYIIFAVTHDCAVHCTYYYSHLFQLAVLLWLYGSCAVFFSRSHSVLVFLLFPMWMKTSRSICCWVRCWSWLLRSLWLWTSWFAANQSKSFRVPILDLSLGSFWPISSVQRLIQFWHSPTTNNFEGYCGFRSRFLYATSVYPYCCKQITIFDSSFPMLNSRKITKGYNR